MRAATLALLLLSACRLTEAPAEALAVAASADTTRTRAEAAGLTPEQTAALESLGVPVYVPDLPGGWGFRDLTSAAPVYGGGAYPEYTLRYRTAGGACLVLDAASEGIGDVFVDDPPHERGIGLTRVPTYGDVRVGWSRPGETAEGWTPGTVQTEWFGTDGLALSVRTEDDCAPATPATPADVVAFLASLRPLDPADDAILLGPVHFAEAIPADEPARTPESAVRAVIGSPEAGGEAVETLRRRDRFAVVLVTRRGLADDSVRDERTRYVVARGGDGWQVVSAGAQRRCQAGRGAQTWSPELCA